MQKNWKDFLPLQFVYTLIWLLFGSILVFISWLVDNPAPWHFGIMAFCYIGYLPYMMICLWVEISKKKKKIKT